LTIVVSDPRILDLSGIRGRKMKRSWFIAVLLFLCIAGLGMGGYAQTNGKEMKDAVHRVDKASEVVSEIMKADDKSIPRDLLKKAKGIVVFPGNFKAAFIVGGQGGHGVAIRRTGNGWSAPAFLKLGGGSIGPQIGGSSTDYVLVVLDDAGVQNLLKDKFEMGAEGSVAAGPVGRTAAATTNATLDTGILTYSRSKGLFAGVSLKGAVITQDEDMNKAVYGKSARQVIGEPPVTAADAPASLRKLGDTVQMYAK
jgi:lipid-binding SYLF domain-containing protein